MTAEILNAVGSLSSRGFSEPLSKKLLNDTTPATAVEPNLE